MTETVSLIIRIDGEYAEHEAADLTLALQRDIIGYLTELNLGDLDQVDVSFAHIDGRVDVEHGFSDEVLRHEGTHTLRFPREDDDE